MAEDPETTRAKAEAKFKKQEHARRESEKVWEERAAAGREFDAKRARLKALRLAKEASEPQKERPRKGKAPAK